MEIRIAPPSPTVLDAIEFLLRQPDAADFRRRAQEMVRRIPGSDADESSYDYSAADRYVVEAARTRRAELEPDPAHHHH
ncbi:hypothetical protein ACFVX3_31370 [Rhodococcus erythropolis]